MSLDDWDSKLMISGRAAEVKEERGGSTGYVVDRGGRMVSL